MFLLGYSYVQTYCKEIKPNLIIYNETQDYASASPFTLPWFCCVGIFLAFSIKYSVQGGRDLRMLKRLKEIQHSFVTYKRKKFQRCFD